jgi:hypothetical protein
MNGGTKWCVTARVYEEGLEGKEVKLGLHMNEAL